jgi:hypothetical protein
MTRRKFKPKVSNNPEQQSLFVGKVGPWHGLKPANDPQFDPTPIARATALPPPPAIPFKPPPRARRKREPWPSLDERRLCCFLFKVQRGCCAICHRHKSVCGWLEKDHDVAVINDGGNYEDNQRLICRRCHLLKTSHDLATRRRFA